MRIMVASWPRPASSNCCDRAGVSSPTHLDGLRVQVCHRLMLPKFSARIRVGLAHIAVVRASGREHRTGVGRPWRPSRRLPSEVEEADGDVARNLVAAGRPAKSVDNLIQEPV